MAYVSVCLFVCLSVSRGQIANSCLITYVLGIQRHVPSTDQYNDNLLCFDLMSCFYSCDNNSVVFDWRIDDRRTVYVIVEIRTYVNCHVDKLIVSSERDMIERWVASEGKRRVSHSSEAEILNATVFSEEHFSVWHSAQPAGAVNHRSRGQWRVSVETDAFFLVAAAMRCIGEVRRNTVDSSRQAIHGVSIACAYWTVSKDKHKRRYNYDAEHDLAKSSLEIGRNLRCREDVVCLVSDAVPV